MDCVLAYDFGGSFLKAGLFSMEGDSIAEETADQKPPVTDHRGVSEKDPNQWWTDFVDIAGRLFQRPEDKRVAYCRCCRLGRHTNPDFH